MRSLAMRPRIRIRHVLTGLLLIAAWCALWGSFSIANLASGSVIAALVLGTGIGSECRGGVRLGPLLRLGGVVFVDLVRSTASVAGSVFSPDNRVDEAIIAVKLPGYSEFIPIGGNASMSMG